MSTEVKNRAEVVAPEGDQLVTLISNYAPNRPLVRGRKILCPFCEKEQDILEFQALNFVDKYAESLVPIIKCRLCRHAFSLRP